MALRKLVLDVVTRSKTDGINSLSSSLKNLAGPAAIGAVVTGFAKIVSGALNAADKIGKLATNTGVSTEAIQRWGHAAEIGGTNIESLVKGQQAFARVLEDARDGLGSAEEKIESLGLSVKDFAGLSPEQAFEKAGDALTLMEDATNKAAVSQELFGRFGKEAIAVFGDAPGTFRRVGAELDNIVDEDKIRRAEQFNDTMTDLKNEGGAAFQSLILELTPLLQGLANGLGFAAEHFDKVTGSVKFVVENFTPLGGIINTVRDASALLSGDMSKLDDVLLGVAETIPGVGTVVGFFRKDIGELREEWRKYNETMDVSQSELDAVTAKTEHLYEKYGAYQGNTKDLATAQADLKNKMSESELVAKDYAVAIDSVGTSVLVVNPTLGDLEGSLTNIDAATRKHTETVRGLANAYDALAISANKAAQIAATALANKIGAGKIGRIRTQGGHTGLTGGFNPNIVLPPEDDQRYGGV